MRKVSDLPCVYFFCMDFTGVIPQANDLLSGKYNFAVDPMF
jgi:hypothetical protein